MNVNNNKLSYKVDTVLPQTPMVMNEEDFKQLKEMEQFIDEHLSTFLEWKHRQKQIKSKKL